MVLIFDQHNRYCLFAWTKMYCFCYNFAKAKRPLLIGYYNYKP